MISLQTLPVLVLWGVVIVRLWGLFFGWKLGVLPAVFVVALGATLNIDQVYLFVDQQLLGDQNYLNLIVHLLMGVAFTDLSRLLLQATGRAGNNNNRVKVLVILGLVLAVVQVALLAASEAYGSATNFTDTFASMFTVALYQTSFFGWVGLVLGYTGAVCLSRDKHGESRSFRVGFDILSIGCLAGLTAVALKMVMIWLEFSDVNTGFDPALYIVYRVFVALTIICFAAGFLLPSYDKIKAAIAARKKTADALDALRPIVQRVVGTAEGRRSMDAVNISLNARSSKTQLYRRFIFIGDIRVLDPDLLSDQEIEIIDEIGKDIEYSGSTDSTRYPATRV